MSTALQIVEDETRELVRRRGIDPSSQLVDVRVLVDDVISEYLNRSVTSALPPLGDPKLVARTVLDVVAGFGPLQPLLDDPSVEEIWINEPGRVFVARRGRSELTTVILTADEVSDLVERMLRTSGRRIDLSTPFVDAMLPDGSRLHVVIPQITRSHMAVNIRKFILGVASLDEIIALGSLTEAAARFLEAAVVAGLNILVAGGTQAGKTTLLNALCAGIPARERVVTAEEVFELQIPLPDVVAMQTRQPNLEGTGEIPIRRLVKEALRMRPSRIIVGEVRQEECLDLLIALNSGLPGMCTIHANSAREALVKMCTLPLLAGSNISAAFVVPTVASCVDLVVHLGTDASGHRRVREIVGVTGRVEGDVIETSDIFSSRSGRLERADGYPPHEDRFAAAGIDLAAALGHGPAHRAGPHRGRDVGAAAGLMFGVGLLLVWRSRRRPAPAALSGHQVGWAAKREDVLRQAGVDGVGARQLLAAQTACAVLVTLLVAVVTAALSVAVCFGAFAFFLPITIVKRMRSQRQTALRELWPEAVDNLGSAVRAGMSLPEAVSALAVRGPLPLQAAFGRFGAAYRSSGRFANSLDALKADLADPVGDRVCETLRVAREVGGSDLGTVLRTLSELLRADARTRSELETRQGWVVNAARLAVGAPWIVLLLLGTQSTTLTAYNTASGTVILVVGAFVCVAAYRIMLRIGRLPEEARVLR